MTRRIAQFRRGQKVTGLRKPLNRIVSRLNEPGAQLGGSDVDLGFDSERNLLLEIVTLNASDLTCVIPGETDPGRFLYTVSLPAIFTEAGRGLVSYTYTDINNRVADGSENQQLTPEFIIGEVIHVVQIDDGTAGSWIFVGDGRMWAKV